MIRLTDVIQGRNNNFHLLRMVAASAVLFSHAFPLSTGARQDEPLRAALGCTFGSIAVDLFFLISGMLVTLSLVRRGSAVEFAKARFFRIWPGLIAAILFVMLLIGPAVTTLSPSDYFTSRHTMKYLLFNMFLLRGASDLPGVFSTNPWPDAVNGSLWTLPAEVRCYLALLAVWFAVRQLNWTGARLRQVATAVWVVLFAWFAWTLRSSTVEESPLHLWLMFSSGTLLYLYREHIVMSPLHLAGALALLVLSAGHAMAFGLVYALALPYVMLCAAYLPRGAILQYNRLGDYSYGVYIYAYPVQQTLMHLQPGLGPIGLFAASMAVTLALAVLSWHLIEKPAMRLARPRRERAPVVAATTTPA